MSLFTPGGAYLLILWVVLKKSPCLWLAPEAVRALPGRKEGSIVALTHCCCQAASLADRGKIAFNRLGSVIISVLRDGALFALAL